MMNLSLKCLSFIKGDYQQSLHYHEQELALSEGMGDDLGLGIACRKVGECHCELGDYEQAIGYQKRHLETSTRIGELQWG